MFNLLDLMRAAQGGAAMENMARQFGLSVDQTRRALEALMPAFALGFQRNATDPMGFANLLRMMGSGQYANFFDQPGLAFTPRAWSEGNQIVAQLFGPEASRQIAEQTAAWAGVAPDIMKQMMPPVATMLMGGLFRSAANEGLADMFEQFAQMLRGGPGGAQARGRADEQAAIPDPFSAWASMLGMWGGAAQSAAKPEPDRPDRPNRPSAPDRADPFPNPFAPWAAMMGAMLGELPAPTPTERSAPEPAAPKASAPEAARHDAFEFFGSMFETGREVQQQQLATLQNIFDAYWGANSKRP